MPTLKAIRREMLSRDPKLGRKETIASLTTTTAVVSALATGGFSAQRFEGKWMLRAEGATADRVRVVTEFASSTGTLTHAGTNYSDTTATSEFLELLEHEPYLYDNAIQVALARTLYRDTTIIPARQQDRNWVGDLDWVQKPSDVMSVGHRGSPVLSRNRYFEQWRTVSAGGVLQPDGWTIAGSGATMARSTTKNRRGTYTVMVTAGGNAAQAHQHPMLDDGVDLQEGRTLTAVLRGGSVDSLKAYVTDGTQSVVSASIGAIGGPVEEAAAEITVAAGASAIEFGFEVGASGTAYVEECYLVLGDVTDAVRRDNYPEYAIPMEQVSFEQGGTLQMYVPRCSGQLVVHSNRSYPTFDATRVSAGTADADESDAPLVPVAVGAIARLYESVGDLGQAMYWERKFQQLAAAHLYVPTKGREFGKTLMGGMYGPSVR